MKYFIVFILILLASVILFLCSPFLLLFVASIVFFLFVYRLASPASALQDLGENPALKEDPFVSIYRTDPNFSKFLFEDFIRLLYKEIHRARGKRTEGKKRLKYFVTSHILRVIESASNPDYVKNISIGLFDVVSLDVSSNWTTTEVFLIASFEEISGEGEKAKSQSYCLEERLYLRRRTGSLSPGPLQMRQLSCPTCLSPLHLDEEGKCKECQKSPRAGDEQWQLTEMVTRLKNDRDTADRVLPTPRQEIAELPPVMDKFFFAERRDFLSRNRHFKLGEFKELVEMLFVDHQKAWTSLNWEPMAAVQTASFHETRLFWVERYRRRKMTPHADDPFVRAIKVVTISHDAHFDYITARISASTVDYTTNENDEVVMGTRDNPVDYREYWTFVRVRRYGHSNVEEPRCPSCTGPLNGVEGQSCPFCSTTVKGLELDWTLARVEREEDYGCRSGTVG